MVLTLDIQKKAAPIIRRSKGWSSNKQGTSRSLGEDITDFILMVEGFDNHVFALSKAEIKYLSDETNNVIAAFIEIDEAISATFDAMDKEIIERFKYLLKALYKLKSLLHLAYTKDVAIKKTPDSIKEGLSAISRAAVLHNLSKLAHFDPSEPLFSGL